MKVILSGATGFIGGEILLQALAHPAIKSLICITRRALPDSVVANPKLKVITITDFSSYSPDVLSQLEGAEACIWALGSPAHKNPDLADSRKIEIGYTLTAAEAFTSSLASAMKEKGKPFRFVYLSGLMAERDTNKSLWFMHNTRIVKGEVENGLLALQRAEGSNLEVSIMRPAKVWPKNTMIPNILVGVLMSIKVDELAAAMINEVVGDVNGTRTLSCDVLRNIGRELLKAGR